MLEVLFDNNGGFIPDVRIGKKLPNFPKATQKQPQWLLVKQ